MRILVCEHFTAEGHANLFVNLCKLLTGCGYEVIAVIPQNFTKDISFCHTVRTNLKYYTDEYSQGSRYRKTLYGLRVQRFISKLYESYVIDATFVVTYDEISLAIGKFLRYIKGPFFVFQNLNPDDILESRIHSFAFSLIKNRVYSVVLGGFIKDILITKLNLSPGRVLVFPHPMNLVDNKIIADIDCVGISNSNDENIVESIIESEKREGLIKKNNLKVILKSRKHAFNNGNLIIISGFIDSSLYDDYISRAKCIFIPFPISFKSRISGTLIDALSNNKCVIGTKTPAIIHSSKCYNNVIKIFEKSSFVNDIKDSSIDNLLKEEDFARFKKQHSDDVLSKILSKAVDNAIANRAMEDMYDF